MAKLRLDQQLLAKGLVNSREEAKKLILAGEVSVNGHMNDKASAKVSEVDELIIKEKPKFVSRGGLKLEAAIQHFNIKVSGKIGLDIGASTGGFTDCLLQSGAFKVYAFDVGTNQLAWKIRNDERVVSRENFNCRDIKQEDIDDQIDILVIDVSFISLHKILKPASCIIKAGADVVCLIKPQFELKREQIGKGGIVKDQSLHHEATVKVEKFATNELKMCHIGTINSPIKGAAGNTEFLAYFKQLA
jgi:23S rRNA (cytidine1920-2'-O)/16S rRNA (cytidine1409-2'-O)-methyltransferase